MTAVARPQVVELHPAVVERPPGLLPWEDACAFASLSASFKADYSPTGAAELSLTDRLIWIEWRRKRLLGAEAAVHIAHAFDRASDSSAKIKTLNRAGVTDHTIRDDIAVAEVLRETGAEDAASLEAIRDGIASAELAIGKLDAGESLEAAQAIMDEDLACWWAEALEETSDDGALKYPPTAEGLAAFLREDALPWRRRWLTVNEARPAIRVQAVAESFDPLRLRQLWEMEARLDRQFEKALSMLIRLQEMRAARCSDPKS